MPNNNDDYIYSYIERKMIPTTPSSNINFNPKRHTSFTVGDLLKRILLWGIILLIGWSFIKYPSAEKAKNNTKTFIEDMFQVSTYTNDILNTIVTQYNSNNFSYEYKSKLEQYLSTLDNYDFNKYSKSMYSTIKLNSEQLISSAKNSINLILESSSQSQYLSGSLNSNLSIFRSNVDLHRDLIISFFEENNIRYQIDNYGKITCWID